MEIILDLGAVSPIGEIMVRHDSDFYHRFQPRKELYYVSEDGKAFYPAGECANTWDPTPPINESLRERFFKGVKTFTSGPIKTKGRYVMVRTFPPLIGDKRSLRESISFTYIGCDEVVVRRGGFDPNAVPVDKSLSQAHDSSELPPQVLGYRYSALRWEELFLEGPLFLGPTPYAFLRENEFLLSVGGVYVLAFEPRCSTSLPVSNVEFDFSLPKDVEVVSMMDSMDVVERREVRRNGAPCLLYRTRVEPGVMQPKTYREYYGRPALALAAKTERPRPLGQLTYSYRYTCDGERFNAAPKALTLILDNEIRAAPPKEFVQGIWIMRISNRFKSYEAVMRRLPTFYKSIGFSSVWGGGAPELYPIIKELGMTRYLNTGGRFCPNGYQFASKDKAFWQRLHKEAHFHFHPRFARYESLGVCPTALGSEAFYPHIRDKAKEMLAAADHVYANWEPYMFQKRGCVCEACRRAFQKFAGLSDAEMEKLWPDCVVDIDSEAHNRFASHGMARVLAQLQRAVQEASQELGRARRAEFVPAASDKEFNPEEPRYRTNGSREYCQQIDELSIWGMPFDVNFGVVNLPRAVGNNLEMLRDITNTLGVVSKYGRRENGRRRPRVYNVSGIHFGEGRFAMPRDHYFTALLNFLCGLDGHSSYREFGVDARYLRLRAKAARTMAMYENWTLHGEAKSDHSIAAASPLPRIPARQILRSKSWAYRGQEILAVGNDYYYPAYVTIRMARPPKGRRCFLVDQINGRVYGAHSGFSPPAMAHGVLVDIPGKEIRIFRIVTSLEGIDLTRCQTLTPTDVQAMFDRERDDLQAQAKYVESLCN